MKTHDKPIGVLVLSCLIFAAGAAGAAEVRTGERVYIPADESVGEDLYAAAREVVVDGVVRGDLVAVGGTVTIRGRVEGSVMAAGGTVLLDGKVGRAARLSGGEVRIGGEVGTDAVAACGTCALGRTGKVGVDMIIAGGDLDLAGVVARGLRAAGGKVRLAGAINAGAQVRAGTLLIEPGAAMPLLAYGARDAVKIPSEARIGKIEEHPEWTPARPSRLGGSLVGALMALVAGAVLLWLLPGRAASASRLLAQRPGAALLWGAVVAIVAPVLMVVGVITVVALPLSMMAAALYAFGMYLGYLLSAYVLGGLALRKVEREVGHFAGLVLGVVILALASLVPVLGALVSALATIAGFGCLWLLFVESGWFTARFRRSGAATEAHGGPSAL